MKASTTHTLQAVTQLMTPCLPFYASHRIQAPSLTLESALEKVNSCSYVAKLNTNGIK